MIEERSPISRILTDSTDRNIISAARARICAGRRGEGKTLIFPRTPRLGQHSTRCTSCTYPSKHKRNWAAPALLGCRFKHNGGAAWQLQIPGTSVVVATRCIERGVVLRDSVSPAHTGRKRKGGALQQGMGAAIQEKENARVTH